MPTGPEMNAFSRTESGGLPNLVDIQVVSQCFGISMRQVRRFIAEGQIPFVRVGHLIRFDPQDSTSGSIHEGLGRWDQLTALRRAAVKGDRRSA